MLIIAFRGKSDSNQSFFEKKLAEVTVLSVQKLGFLGKKGFLWLTENKSALYICAPLHSS